MNLPHVAVVVDWAPCDQASPRFVRMLSANLNVNVNVLESGVEVQIPGPWNVAMSQCVCILASHKFRLDCIKSPHQHGYGPENQQVSHKLLQDTRYKYKYKIIQIQDTSKLTSTSTSTSKI